MSQSPTRTGQPKLSEVARHLVVPSGIVSTGWPAVQAQIRDLGIRFDRWQDGLGRVTVAKRADGKYAAGVGGIVLSLVRQVGKTFTVGAVVFALCILCPGLTVVWTAHRTRTAGETFRAMQSMARRKKIAPFIEQVFTGSGDEEIRFRNGSRILFGARERGFGRGFAEVDVIVFDEAQILTEKALDDMVPATNQSKQPTGALLFFMGTPPKPTDPGEAFRAKRAKALSGSSTDMLYVEFSADQDTKPDDRRQWAKANPSYPRRTPEEAMLRMRENLSDESFLREALGVWDELSKSSTLPGWDERRADAPDETPVAFSVDMTWDRDWASLAWSAAGYVDLHEHRRGAAWVVDEARKLVKAYPDAGFWLDPRGPAATLIDPLREAGVRVEEVPSDEYKRACGGFYDAVTNGELSQSGHPALDAAVQGAVVSGGSGGWVWDRKKGAVISPLVAVTLAWWGSQQRREPRVRSL